LVTAKKSEKIIIRCTPALRKLFRAFVMKYGFEKYDEALLHLIHYYEGKARKRTAFLIA